jgi:hypothetical protein
MKKKFKIMIMWTHLSPCPWNPNRMYNKGELPFAAFDQETINEWLLDYALVIFT